MGCSFFVKNCQTNYSTNIPTPAPNPDPTKWDIVEAISYNNAYILLVRYFGCTNYEGLKVMVYRGKFPGVNTLKNKSLDPHFQPGDNSPIARFKPDIEGLKLAKIVAEAL